MRTSSEGREKMQCGIMGYGFSIGSMSDAENLRKVEYLQPTGMQRAGERVKGKLREN